jgi:hypothetical protein
MTRCVRRCKYLDTSDGALSCNTALVHLLSVEDALSELVCVCPKLWSLIDRLPASITPLDVLNERQMTADQILILKFVSVRYPQQATLIVSLCRVCRRFVVTSDQCDLGQSGTSFEQSISNRIRVFVKIRSWLPGVNCIQVSIIEVALGQVCVIDPYINCNVKRLDTGGGFHLFSHILWLLARLSSCGPALTVILALISPDRYRI